jgi:hypothetical protein
MRFYVVAVVRLDQFSSEKAALINLPPNNEQAGGVYTGPPAPPTNHVKAKL